MKLPQSSALVGKEPQDILIEILLQKKQKKKLRKV